MTLDLEAGLDRLFQCPLCDFVRERNALARELKGIGDAAQATRVKTLPRPTAAAWAVNQLAFVAPEELRMLFDAAADLRQAYENGGTEAIQTAGQTYRRRLDALAQRAQAVLREAGHSADAHVVRRVQGTLSALAGGMGSGDVRAGRLSREIETQGFDVLSDVELAAPASQAGVHGKAPDALDRMADRVRKLQEEMHTANARVASAENEARDAELHAEQARKRVEVAQKAAHEAAAELAAAVWTVCGRHASTPKAEQNFSGTALAAIRRPPARMHIAGFSAS